MTTAKKPAQKKPAPRTKKAIESKQSDGSLTVEQQTFVEELISDRKMIAWKAYQRAFRCVNRKSCEAASSRLLRSVKIQKAIKAAMDARLKRVRFTSDEMFNHLIALGTADATEIMEHRRVNCRHCNGKGFEFQWKDVAEFEKALREVERANATLGEGERPQPFPNNDGGYGYDSQGAPKEGCTNCGGEGYSSTHFHDTRFLTGGPKLLFAGVKETQHGIEVKVHDQMAALKLAMQHMGMLDPKLTLKGDKQNPLMALLQALPGNTIKPVTED